MSTTLSPLTSRTLEVAKTGGHLIDFVAPIRIPAEPVAIDGNGDTDWIVLDARLDPHFQAGRLGMPSPAARRLRAIQNVGVEIDGILIGHELPPGTIARIGHMHPGEKPTDPKTIAKVIGPPPVSASTTKATRVATTAVDLVTKAGIGLGLAAGAIAAAPIAVLGALDLDPVLFGFITDDPDATPGSLAALFYLTHWTN